MAEKEQLVEHVEHLGGRLVHRQHDRLPLLHRILLQVLDEAVGGARVQTGAGLLSAEAQGTAIDDALTGCC